MRSDSVKKGHNIGDTITIQIGGYPDKFAENPIELDGKVQFLREYAADAIVALHFGKNNRIVLTSILLPAVNAGYWIKSNL